MVMRRRAFLFHFQHQELVTVHHQNVPLLPEFLFVIQQYLLYRFGQPYALPFFLIISHHQQRMTASLPIICHKILLLLEYRLTRSVHHGLTVFRRLSQRDQLLIEMEDGIFSSHLFPCVDAHMSFL